MASGENATVSGMRMISETSMSGILVRAKSEATSRSDSPLCLAAMSGHLPVVSLLLERGASASKKDEGGWDPSLAVLRDNGIWRERNCLRHANDI
jgi:ankyrin repeat protein